LGSRRAEPNLRTAEDSLADYQQQMATGLLDLSPAAETLWRQAADAAGRTDWDGAIQLLRQAIEVAGGHRPGLRNRLANFLANRGVKRSNDAIGQLTQAGKQHQEQLGVLTGKIRGHFGGDSCALCGAARHQTYGQGWFTITLQDGLQRQLCGTCKDILHTVQNQTPKPDPAAVRLLQSGEQDLAEAVALDPQNQHARDNLATVRETLDTLPAECRAMAAPLRPAAPPPSKPIVKAPAQAPSGQRAAGPPPAPAEPESAPAANGGAQARFAAILKNTWWLIPVVLILLLIRSCQ
jgi:hypothetical protein